MSAIWIDTDFGFDDLWAILLLRQLGTKLAGISLVAGNAPLPQVTSNALGAQRAYGIDTPFYSGADRPLVRMQETAERILGPFGMQSRGRHLPEPEETHPLPDALPVLAKWLDSGAPGESREVLALGPLTNIANLIRCSPQSAAKISRLVWMGGSAGPGNQSAMAEFNALADPEAAAVICAAELPIDVVDLMLCRKVIFGPSDVPVMPSLMGDLMGGYLDIGLSRGRPGMAIYDPVAAMAAIRPDLFEFKRCNMQVSITADDSYGATTFHSASEGETRLATDVTPDMAHICLTALAEEVANER